jgi:hypothetical protein
MVQLIPLSVSDRGFIRLATKLLAIIIPTLFLHIWLSALFGLEEVRPVTRKLKALVLKPVRIQ